MKKHRLLALIVTAVFLLISLTGCGGGAQAPAQPVSAEPASAEATEAVTAQEPAPEAQAEAAPETEAAQTQTPGEKEAETSAEAAAPAEESSAPAKEFPVEGKYSLFAVVNEGYCVAAAELQMESELTLDEGGTGAMSFDEDEMPVTEWTLENGVVSITMEDGSAASGAFHDGILDLDLYGTGEMLLLFAQDDADISGYTLMTLDELQKAMQEAEAEMPEADSMVAALCRSLDPAAGVHLSYQLHTEYMDATQDFDVYGKGEEFYSCRTTQVSGKEGKVITFFSGGKVYNLDPESMTGVLVTETDSALIAANVMMMDPLYSAIWTKAQEAEYTAEEREIDGKTYQAEVFPAGEYTPEAVFCFDESGMLARYIEGAPVVETSIPLGESVYTVNVIDGDVDASLFDISGYTIP